MQKNTNDVYVIDLFGRLFFKNEVESFDKFENKESKRSLRFLDVSKRFPEIRLQDIVKDTQVHPKKISTLMIDEAGEKSYVNISSFPFVLNDKKHFLLYVEKDYRESSQKQGKCSDCDNKLFENNFLANISHELKTPLNAIIGTCQIALNKSQVDLMQIERIFNSSKALLERIEDLFILSRVNRKKVKKCESNFSLRKIISDINNKFEISLKEKGLRLNPRFSRNVPENFYGNYRILYRVIGYLVKIALRISKRGILGLMINCTERADKESYCLDFRFFFTIVRGKAQRTFSIEKFLENRELGLEFKAAEKELRESDSGLCCKEYQKNGIEFDFSLIFSKVKSNVIHTDKTAVADLKVLVVDDVEVVLSVVKRMFETLGTRVTCCQSGESAVKILDKKSFHIIFMDLEMNGISGYETARIIRKKFAEKLLNTPIIAMTAHSGRSISSKISDNGIDDCVTKPFNIDDIIFILNKWVFNESDTHMQPVISIEANSDTSLKSANFDFDKLLNDTESDYKSALMRTGNKPEFYLRLIRKFIMNHLALKEDLYSIYNKSGVRGLKKEFHRIKGIASNLGFMGLSSAVSRAEKVLGNSDETVDVDFEIELVNEKILPILKLKTPIEEYIEKFEHAELGKQGISTEKNRFEYSKILEIIVNLEKRLTEYKPKPCIELISKIEVFSLSEKIYSLINEIKTSVGVYDFDEAQRKISVLHKMFLQDIES